MAITYNDLYLDVRQTLRGSGVEAATLEARELVCFGTGKSREELVRDSRLYASPEREAQVRRLVERRLAGEPVAYLIGEWEFYGLPLDISQDVLIPRPDTEVLAEQAIAYIQTLGECRVLDLCAGSGCVGLAIASQAPQARVSLGEIDDSALKICRQNIRRCGLSARVSPIQARWRSPPGPWGSSTASSATRPTSPPPTSPAWSPPSGTTSPIWPWTAGRTAWTSTAPSPKAGGRPWSPAGGCISRSASGRPTGSCASCGARASATCRSSRTTTRSQEWCWAPSAKRFEQEDYHGKTAL